VENCREWEQTNAGFYDTVATMSIGTQTYAAERAKGATRTTTFYKTTTDLSSLDPAELKQCTNLTGILKTISVPREAVIKEFYEQQTGKPYMKGAAFYQLTKPERIQAHKDIVLREKGRATFWGGAKARELVGLEPYVDGDVKPGNHANYDIFVQSTSDNRKLVRGTTLLVAK
jgi:hypothetical protein